MQPGRPGEVDTNFPEAPSAFESPVSGALRMSKALHEAPSSKEQSVSAPSSILEIATLVSVKQAANHPHQELTTIAVVTDEARRADNLFKLFHGAPTKGSSKRL